MKAIAQKQMSNFFNMNQRNRLILSRTASNE